MCGIDTLLPRHWSVDFVNQFLLLLKFFFFYCKGKWTGWKHLILMCRQKKKRKRRGGHHLFSGSIGGFCVPVQRKRGPRHNRPEWNSFFWKTFNSNDLWMNFFFKLEFIGSLTSEFQSRPLVSTTNSSICGPPKKGRKVRNWAMAQKFVKARAHRKAHSAGSSIKQQLRRRSLGRLK